MMQTNIHPALKALPEVAEAEEILRRCVHCGFCTASCPTYQLLGDELDGPRGRIYLIKNLLEENTISKASMTHLDRCLTCRACETACPSGVEYGQLLDIGRSFAAGVVRRPLFYRLMAFLLRQVIPRAALLRLLLWVGRLFRPLLPMALGRHIPQVSPARHRVVSVRRSKILLLGGCVQSAATPNVVASLSRLLSFAGQDSEIMAEGCCGALDYHLSAQEAGKRRMRKVIDLLYERIGEVDALVSSATGCGVTIAEYPHIFRHDPAYVGKAQAIADKLVDAVTLLETMPIRVAGRRVAVHTPCSMAHGMKLGGKIERLLTRAGYTTVTPAKNHLCCGSAGSYSILQPGLSTQLRDRKLAMLEADKPDVIVTANIGCQMQLASGANTPVMHWLELLADDLPE